MASATCPKCGKHFQHAESIEKYHGWCTGKEPDTTARVIATQGKPTITAILEEAEAAGHNAACAAKPTPMIVQQHASVFDDASPVVEQWHVPEGVCGFSTIRIRPGTHTLAKTALLRYGAEGKDGHVTSQTWRSLPGEPLGHRSEYYGGVSIGVMGYNQSMERKSAYAHAFLEVIVRHFPTLADKSYVDTRMD